MYRYYRVKGLPKISVLTRSRERFEFVVFARGPHDKQYKCAEKVFKYVMGYKDSRFRLTKPGLGCGDLIKIAPDSGN